MKQKILDLYKQHSFLGGIAGAQVKVHKNGNYQLETCVNIQFEKYDTPDVEVFNETVFENAVVIDNNRVDMEGHIIMRIQDLDLCCLKDITEIKNDVKEFDALVFIVE